MGGDSEPARPSSFRFAYLLAAQLALLLLYPFAADAGPRPGLFGVFAITLFLAALRAIAQTHWIRFVALLLGVPSIAGHLVSFAIPAFPIFVPWLACEALFLAFVTAVIFHEVLTSTEVTTDTLYGAVTGYLLLGMTWGIAYGVVEQIWPGSFRSASVTDGQMLWPEFIFFSFSTLTTVGYGDVVAIGDHARSLAILEAVAGTMYMAVFISRLVGLHAQRGKPTMG